MFVWFDLNINSQRILVNMNTVSRMYHNDPSDPSKGTAIFFTNGDHVVVQDLFDDLYVRLRSAAGR